MAKHHDKIKKALEQRIAATPNGAGFKKPGSMNKKRQVTVAKQPKDPNSVW